MVLSNMNKTFTALYPNNKQSINVGRGVNEKHAAKSGGGSQNSCNCTYATRVSSILKPHLPFPFNQIIAMHPFM